jgi:hypothetical protein
MDTINYWLTGAGMIFSSIGFWTFVQHQLDKRSASRQAMLGLMYLGVKMSCSSLLKRGWASTEEIEDIEKYMYEPYKAMGGNGTAEMLMNKVKNLPNQPKEEGVA